MTEEEKRPEEQEGQSAEQPAEDRQKDVPEPQEPEPSDEHSQPSQREEPKKDDAEASEDDEGHEKEEEDTEEAEPTAEPESESEPKPEEKIEPRPDDIPVFIDTSPLKKVFVVACEREKINKDSLDFLKKYGIEAMIVNHVDEKRPIAEIMHEQHRVHFALIILAGDDFNYDRQTGKPAEAVLSPKTNAVFYLGYLLARLGNLRTLTIYKEQRSFRLPTGSHNAAFVPYVKGGLWEEILLSKLKTLKIL